MSIYDMVRSPAHYRGTTIDVIDVIEDWGLGYHLGNALKYLLRAGKKGDTAQDVQKSAWYFERAMHDHHLRAGLAKADAAFSIGQYQVSSEFRPTKPVMNIIADLQLAAMATTPRDRKAHLVRAADSAWRHAADLNATPEVV